MKNNLLMIGQMADLNHTTVATLRLYDNNGLLKPVSIHPENGYRIYDVQQSAAFRLIQHNKDLGLNLQEIKELFDHSSLAYLKEIYTEKSSELDRRIEELRWKKREIQRILAWADYLSHCPPSGTFTMEYIHSSHIYKKPALRNHFQEDFGSVSYDITHLEGELDKQGIRGVHSYHAFLTMKLEDFLAGHYQTAQIGVKLHEEEAERAAQLDPNACGFQESTTSACAYFDDFDQATAYLDRLRAYCEAQHCEMVDDVTCQILGTIDTQDFRKSKNALRLQIPIKPIRAGNRPDYR